ncbi:MAG TPA: histidine kinase [Holophagaceae bacterium]|nr:histidine kinase [Holophagaceae bacterium]
MIPAEAPVPWRWPRVTGRWAALTGAFFLGNALWRGAMVNFDLQGSRADVPWPEPYVWELTSGLVVWALMPLIQAVVLNAPWRGVRWGRFLALHLAGTLLFWILHVGGLWGLRVLFYRWVGWGTYHYGELVPRILGEGGKDLFAFASLAAILHAVALRQARQARELALSRLETELREARLQALAAQLDPHFLFNALNTLSAVIYEDVPKADSLISDLGLMLRDNLQADGPTWPLQRELDHLGHYLAFVRARFGDRVKVAVVVEPGMGGLPVPRFALQRLVENALKHNEGEAGRTLTIEVSARREAGAARLQVMDDGVGFTPSESGGLGLENLRRSLNLLHGDRAGLVAGNGPGGGATVELILPLEAPGA